MKRSVLFAASIMFVLTISSCKLDPGGILKPNEIEPIILEDRYDDDVTLKNHNEDGVDYIVTGKIEVYGGKMTIEPGVTIEFEAASYIIVAIDGSLSAVGTSGEPIRMMADENEPSWAGIYINSDKSNKIHHCIIDNAGSGRKHGVYNDFAAAITLDGKVSIENTTISSSGNVGVKINNNDINEITSFEGNTIKDCAGFPILTNINYLQALNLSNSIFSDNGKNMIGVEDAYSNRLTTSTTLDDLDIPYFFNGQFEIYEDLTLNRGVEIVMDNNSLIEHAASGNYKLQVKGTDSDHVVIKGAESEAGYWQGILIGSQNNGNIFEYLDISDGGGQKLTFGEGKANISMEGFGSLELANCTSARSGDCEVFLSSFGGTNYNLVNSSPAITKVCKD